MNFTIKTLSLYRDLCYTARKDIEIIKTESLWSFTTGIKQNEMEPKKDLFLLNGQFLGYAIKAKEVQPKNTDNAIHAGKYLFLQGLIENENVDNSAILTEAAEALYLEGLWLEKEVKNNSIFVRYLEEDGKNVFQLFREINDA